MKADQFLIGAMRETVRNADNQYQTGGNLAANTSLWLAHNRWVKHDDKCLETILDALNQLVVSRMREEFISLIEGMLAIREIKPTMDNDEKWPAYEAYKSALLPEKKNYGKCLVCKRCHHQNPETAFDCVNCGWLLHES